MLPNVILVPPKTKSFPATAANPSPYLGGGGCPCTRFVASVHFSDILSYTWRSLSGNPASERILDVKLKKWMNRSGPKHDEWFTAQRKPCEQITDWCSKWHHWIPFPQRPRASQALKWTRRNISEWVLTLQSQQPSTTSRSGQTWTYRWGNLMCSPRSKLATVTLRLRVLAHGRTRSPS